MSVKIINITFQLLDIIIQIKIFTHTCIPNNSISTSYWMSSAESHRKESFTQPLILHVHSTQAQGTTLLAGKAWQKFQIWLPIKNQGPKIMFHPLDTCQHQQKDPYPEVETLALLTFDGKNQTYLFRHILSELFGWWH